MNSFQNKFIYALAFICLSFSCCSNDSGEPDINSKPIAYTISGKVVDQVTLKTIPGATVYLGHTFCEQTMNPSVYKQVISDAAGEFKISFPPSALDRRNYGCAIVYAVKDGYKGSKQQEVTAGGRSSFLIELYHSTQLQLRVTNDTLSDTDDETRIRVYRFLLEPGHYPSDYNLYCKGKQFDSIFTLNLWANYPYTLEVGYPIVRTTINKTFEPDTTTMLSITF